MGHDPRKRDSPAESGTVGRYATLNHLRRTGHEYEINNGGNTTMMNMRKTIYNLRQ